MREKYSGTRKSLANKTRRPHHHPKGYTEKAILMIKRYKAQNKETGLVVLWIKLRQNGYTKSTISLYKVMQRLGIYKKVASKKKKYEPKPYQDMTYPGERVQIDVKYVPSNCLTKEIKETEGR